MPIFGMNKIIGIDVGNHSIKTVQILSTLRGFQISHVAVKKRNREETDQNPENSEQLSNEIKLLIEEYSLEGDIFVTSLSGKYAAVRNTQLPFSDIKKINQTMKYEVESIFPLSMDEVIVDYFVLSEHPESGSQILVFAVKKGVISEHIKTLSTAHIDPVIIDLDCLALTHSFLKTNELDKKGIVALVDLGATKTSATIVKDCLIYSMRVILSGGDDITRAIGKDFEVDFSKAEEIKIFEEGLSLLHEDNEEVQQENRSKKLSASIVKGLSRIESELSRFFHAFHSYCGEEQIDKIFITGGTSKIKNIEKYFEKKFGIQTSLFYPLDYFPHTTPSIDGEAHAVLGTSLGLALRGLSEKAKRLNFRKEEFVFKKKFEEIHGKIIQSIVFACILVGLLIGNFIFTYHSKVNEKERLQSKIEKLFVQTLPEVKVRVKGKEVEMMRNKIKETKATSFLFGVQGKGTTLDVLREISLSVSEGSKTRITNLDIASERIELSGETETFETVDKFKEGLGKSPLFKEIQVKSAEMNHRKGLVEFKFRIKRAIQ